MKHYTLDEIQSLKTRYRANLINSCIGYKPCALIGTKGEGQKKSNLAIFNSIVHIGSHPPMIGFILRPVTVPRHTYINIKKTNHFTINIVTKDWASDAHHTAARYDENNSEFDNTNLKEVYLDGFHAPYVEQSPIKIGCTYQNEYLIKENDTILIIGKIQHIYLEEKAIHQDGWVQLDTLETVACNGLDGYALPTLIDRYEYAKPHIKTKPKA